MERRQTITAYSFTFAVFLLFAGRLSDLFPAEIVFEAGFFLLGIFTLVTSFVTHSKYGFLILRGIGGVCGAMSESWICSTGLRRLTQLDSCPVCVVRFLQFCNIHQS